MPCQQFVILIMLFSLTAVVRSEEAKTASADTERLPPAASADDQESARKLFEDALEIEKNGDAKTAGSQFEAAAKLDPRNSACLNHLAWFLAVTAPEHLRNLDKALKYAQQAAKVSAWKDKDILDTLAEVHFRRKEYAQAVEFGKKALADGLSGKSKKKYLEEQLKKYVDAASAQAKAPVAPSK